MSIYERSMEIGYLFNLNGYNDSDDTGDWSCSEECATLADLVIFMVDTTGVKTVDALEIAVALINGNKVKTIDQAWDNAWNDYCRGFLAGQIIGKPTKANIKKAKEAEDLWLNDYKGKYGYYHEVLEEVEAKS